MNSCVIRLRCLPFGFFEKELLNYFKQFGKVVRVRVLRSKKGYPTGTSFVQFDNVAVAEIAAETMNNYLLAERRVQSKILKVDEVPKCIKEGGTFEKFDRPLAARVRHARQHFEVQTKAQEFNGRKRFISNLRKNLKKLNKMGIEYTYDFEAKIR